MKTRHTTPLSCAFHLLFITFLQLLCKLGWFLAAHGSLWLCFQLRGSWLSKALGLICLASWAFLVATSRVYLGVHSEKQCICGSVFGLIAAAAWYGLEMKLWPMLQRLQKLVNQLWGSLNISCEGYLSHSD